MHFTCEKDKLQKALNYVSKVVSTKTTMPILSHVLIETDGSDAIRIRATDLNIGYSIAVPAQVMMDGRAALPAKLLTEIVGALGSAPVSLSVDDNKADLRSGRSHFTLGVMAPEEYPSTNEILPSRATISLPAADVRTILRRVVPAVATEEGSPPLYTGVLLSVSDGTIEAMATDGRRIAYQRLRNPAWNRSEPWKVVVPARAMIELGRVLGDSKDPVGIALDDNMLNFFVNGNVVVNRTIEGNFPDHRKVIPTEHQRSVRIGRESLLASLRRMLTVSQEKERPSQVAMEFLDGELKLRANTPGLGMGRESLSVVLTGEPIHIAFNGRYLMDVLGALECDEIEIEMRDNRASGVVVPLGDDDYRYVLCPIALRDQDELARLAAAA